MSFNPDPKKRTKEVIFLRKVNRPSHSTLVFNSTALQEATRNDT